MPGAKAGNDAQGAASTDRFEVGALLGATRAGALDAKSYRPSSPVRVALVSSGVDTSSLPAALRPQVLHANRDLVGYGTYAASLLLQAVPGARITSFEVYRNGSFSPDMLLNSLDQVYEYRDSFDVVLHAWPTHEFLDPVSATMVRGEWDAISNSIMSNPLQGNSGPVLGVAIDPGQRAEQTRFLASSEEAALERFAKVTSRWERARLRTANLTKSGLAVVMPAGDVGPGPQTILGLANLPDVITVGASSAGTVSPTSAAGPSIDGHLKPDLLAPTGLVGILPEGSPVARGLRARGLIDSNLVPSWQSGAAPSQARVRLDSSVTSAAIVAGAVGSMAAGGVRDVPRQRGALMAAATPVAGVPVWRQGAGVLSFSPSASFASTRALVTAGGDLGPEPAKGAWATTIPVAQGTAVAATVALRDFVGVGPDARNVVRSIAPSSAPPVSAAASTKGIELSVPAGTNRYEGGLFCGWTEVSLAGGSGSVTPGGVVSGTPGTATEHVPTCLVKGSGLRVFSFYIHDQAAEAQTWALLPKLATGMHVLDRPLMNLPTQPLSQPLYTGVTDSAGWATLTNVPPGYFKVLMLSDYASPVTQTVNRTVTGQTVTKASDLGDPTSYETFDALVLSSACDQQIPANPAWSGPTCSQQFLESRFGPGNVRYDKPTGTYMVDTPGRRNLRVAFSFMKKMPGPAITARTVDLLGFDDLNLAAPAFPGAPSGTATTTSWQFSPGAGDGVKATFNPTTGNTPGRALGLAGYEFNLTQPNLMGEMDLNFRYTVQNAAVVPIVQMGDTYSWGAATHRGVLDLPYVDLLRALGPDDFSPARTSGVANFHFRGTPHGAAKGRLWLILVPASATGAPGGSVSAVEMNDLSFELTTWARGEWPATLHNHGQGHEFSLDSNYAPSQMNSPCRLVVSGQEKTNVCEDWTVLVHVPGDDAAVADVIDVPSGRTVMPELAASGGRFADPARGVTTFACNLAFASAAQAEAGLPRLSINGRFWEQMSIPRAVLIQHPRIGFHIVDNVRGRSSTLLTRTQGGMPLSPYLGFGSSGSGGPAGPIPVPHIAGL